MARRGRLPDQLQSRNAPSFRLGGVGSFEISGLDGDDADGIAPVAWPRRANRITQDGVSHTRRQPGDDEARRRALAGHGHGIGRVRRPHPVVGGRAKHRVHLRIQSARQCAVGDDEILRRGQRADGRAVGLLDGETAQGQFHQIALAGHGDVAGQLPHQARQDEPLVVLVHGGGRAGIRHRIQRRREVAQRFGDGQQVRQGRGIDDHVVAHAQQDDVHVVDQQQVAVGLEPGDGWFDDHRIWLVYWFMFIFFIGCNEHLHQ